MNALGSTIVKMVADFRLFPHFDRGTGDVGGLKDNSVLRRRHNADVEGYLPPVDPVADEDVS